MKKCFCLLLTLLCISYSAVAASGFRIKGKIVDANNNQPIDFADVLLFREGDVNPVFHALPDPDGTFRIADVKDGKYNLLVRLVGYDLYNRPGIVLDAVSKAVDLGTIAMKPLEVGLAEVEVVAQKKQVIYKLDKKVIEASSNLLAGGGSAVDILENTPSIRVDAEGEVSFRGSTGFTVYVDGKPSVFSGTQALEQIPAGHIENIEIITTPSARHDTGGDVGIINIVTKKHAQHGFSGMVNLTGSTVLSRGVDFLVSQQNKASRWYLGGVWSDRLRKSDFDQEKTTIISDTATTSHSNGPRKSNNFNYSMKAGWMYTLPHTTLNADFEGGYGGRTRNGDLDYKEKRLTDGATFGEGDYYSRDDYDLHETYFQGTIGFDHKFDDKGHQLMGSFYLKYGGNAMEYFQSDLFNKNNEREKGHRAWEDEHRWTVRGNLDYIYPYSKTGRIEGGYQYFSYLEDGDYTMHFWDPVKKEFYNRDDIYNTFYFQHGINSVYAIVADSYKSFDFQAGVRGEHTHRVLRSSIPGKDRTYNKFEFFPSLHLGYTFPKEHKLLVSYSRRITRPELFFMEPGEYAAHDPEINIAHVSKNNWKAGISEAAFLTGIERNADVVALSSYAPLFARVNYTQWAPDLIWMDENTSWGTPSYYVQKLFSKFRAESTLDLGDQIEKLRAQGIYCSAGETEDKTTIVKLVNTTDNEVSIDLENEEGKALTPVKETVMCATLTDYNCAKNPMCVAPKETVECSGKIKMAPQSFIIVEIK